MESSLVLESSDEQLKRSLRNLPLTRLVALNEQYSNAAEGSARKLDAGQELMETISHRLHLDTSINMMGELLFGVETGPFVLDYVVPQGQALVEDWDCLKSVVRFIFRVVFLGLGFRMCFILLSQLKSCSPHFSRRVFHGAFIFGFEDFRMCFTLLSQFKSSTLEINFILLSQFKSCTLHFSRRVFDDAFILGFKSSTKLGDIIEGC